MKGPRVKLSHLIVSILWFIMLGNNIKSVAALGFGMRAGNTVSLKGILNTLTSKTAVQILETPVINSNTLNKSKSPTVSPNSPQNMSPAVVSFNYGGSAVQQWKPMFAQVEEGVSDICGSVNQSDIDAQAKKCGFRCSKTNKELQSLAMIENSKLCQETQIQLVQGRKEMVILEEVIRQDALNAEAEAKKRYNQQVKLENIKRSRELTLAEGEKYTEKGNVEKKKAEKRGEFNKEAKEREAAMQVLNQRVVEQNQVLKNTKLNAKLNRWGRGVKKVVGGAVGGVMGGAAMGITEPIEEVLNTIRTNKGTLLSIVGGMLCLGALFMPGFSFGMVRSFVKNCTKVLTMPVKYFINYTMSFATWTLRKILPNRVIRNIDEQVQNNVAPQAPRPSRWGPPIQSPKPSRWGPSVSATLEPGQVISFGGVNRTFKGMRANGTPRFSRWSN